jgi:hypothetical protein
MATKQCLILFLPRALNALLAMVTHFFVLHDSQFEVQQG